MSTARRFNASCPDCGRWRCLCDLDSEYIAAELEQVAHNTEAGRRCWGTPEVYREAARRVRTGPPPADIRQRLAELRAQYVAHMAKLGRPA